MSVRKNPDWNRDELILACDLVWVNGWHELRAEYPQVIELSKLLQRYEAHPASGRTETFRNPNSVGRKTTDIATQHPDYRGAPTRGGRLDRGVLADFMNNPDEMHRQALALRAAILAGDDHAEGFVYDLADPDLDDASAQEGGLLERMHLRRERDQGIRNKVVEAHKGKHGRRLRSLWLQLRRPLRRPRRGLYRVPSCRPLVRIWGYHDQNRRFRTAVLELPSDDPPDPAVAESR